MSDPAPQPGATYKFTVRSADEAVRTIRERLGENAKVLSVRQVSGEGIAGLFSKRLEVIAQVAEAPAHALPEANLRELNQPGHTASALLRSDEPALPMGIAQSSGYSQPALLPAPRNYDTGHAASSPQPSPAAHRSAPPADVPSRLPDLLRRSGFSEAMVSRLLATPDFAQHASRPLHQSLADAGRALRQTFGARAAKPLPARTAFVGTPGVGRTTALCKWLAREIFTQRRTGRVVKAEFDRPNPAEGLAVFCEALGLTLEYYAPPMEADPAAALAVTADVSLPTLDGSAATPAAPNAFLYADLPGLSLRTPAENRAQLRFLEQEKFSGRVLVLNAAYDLPMLRRAYTAGRDMGATHLVFTHLDELEHWGKLWDFLLDSALTPLFLATGPSLTGDCEEDAVTAIMRRTLPGA